jgi:hypothetical protein
MSLLNNKDKGGNSSKFSWNHSVLKGLQSIYDGTQGLATEGTLISVLNAIVASDQDIEVLLVRDEAVGNGDPVLKQVTNYETGIPVITYENVDGTTYNPSPNPPEYVYLDPSAVLNLMLAELLDQGLTLDSIEVITTNTLIELVDQGLSLDGIETLITNLNSIVATEITLAQVLVELQAINTDLDGLSLEATQQLVLTALNTVISNTTGLATEVTAALINSNVVLGNITLNSLLTAFNAEDFATETTLANLNSKFNTLGQKASATSHPVVLSTEQEIILNAIKIAIENLDLDADGLATEVTLAALLLAFNTEDFATETTLTLLAATDFATETTLASLLTAFNTEDFASQVTLQALLTAFNTVDFSTEVTLNALLTAFNAEDFATETTLASVLVDTTSIDTRLTPQVRQHFVLTANAVGSIIPGSLCGSVFNAGNADGIWAGMTIPPGVTITWSPIGNRDTYPVFFFNGNGTSLIIEYTM